MNHQALVLVLWQKAAPNKTNVKISLKWNVASHYENTCYEYVLPSTPPPSRHGQLLPGLVCFSARGIHFLPSLHLVIHAGGGHAVWVMLSHIWPSYFEVWKDFSVAADVIGGAGRQDAWLLSAVVVGRPSSRRSWKERERQRSSGVHQTEVNIVRPPNVLAILLCC